MLDIRTKLAISVLIGSFTIGSVYALIQASDKITSLRYEIKQLQQQLKECQATNLQLVNQLQIKQEDYNKALKDLQEASIKPVKRVYVRQVIKEPMRVSNEECQQLVDLIKQAEEQMQK
jgi:gas vesicle protein